MSGVFWAAGSTGIYDPAVPAPPNPYLTLVAKVGDLAHDAATYSAQIAVGFDTMVDNIVSDPTKLMLVGTNTASGGKWAFPNQTSYDTFQPMFDKAATIYFFTQLFGSVYTWDEFLRVSSSVTTPRQVGGTQIDLNTNLPVCVSLYPNVSDSNLFRYKQTIGNPAQNDMLILGGPITRQGWDDASVNLPNSTAMNTLYATDQLNLNFDQIWAPTSPIARRSPPNTINFGKNSEICIPK